VTAGGSSLLGRERQRGTFDAQKEKTASRRSLRILIESFFSRSECVERFLLLAA
jgi:hypothetical protein